MTILKEQNGNSLTIALEGRLDTIAAPKLDEMMKESLTGVDDLTLDLEKLEYISSAGLRVILSAQKTMNRQGKMTVKNVGENVQEIFDSTGFSGILEIE